jgi:hypothetical protein
MNQGEIEVVGQAEVHVGETGEPLWSRERVPPSSVARTDLDELIR